MVAQEPLAPLSLLLDDSGGEHQLGWVSDLFVGQHHPDLFLNVVGHLLLEEGSMLEARDVKAHGRPQQILPTRRPWQGSQLAH